MPLHIAQIVGAGGRNKYRLYRNDSKASIAAALHTQIIRAGERKGKIAGNVLHGDQLALAVIGTQDGFAIGIAHAVQAGSHRKIQIRVALGIRGDHIPSIMHLHPYLAGMLFLPFRQIDLHIYMTTPIAIIRAIVRLIDHSFPLKRDQVTAGQRSRHILLYSGGISPEILPDRSSRNFSTPCILQNR